MAKELSPDLKGQASITFGDVIRQTVNNYPDKRYRPEIKRKTTFYTIEDIDPSPYRITVTTDGTGTKPELAERLYDASREDGLDPTPFKSLAFDAYAMIDGDEARYGRFMMAIAQVFDVNSAEDPSVVQQLAEGSKEACDAGHFALLNGETAELGYRTSGYGETHINWNAFGVSLVVPGKEIDGKRLSPGQPIVVFREKSIRSNGLSKARGIMEAEYLSSLGFSNKVDFVYDWLKEQGIKNPKEFTENWKKINGHDPIEQILLPWHLNNRQTTRELLMPSKLYGPIIYQAQGGVDGERKVDMIAAAHVSGGGVPEKGKRMVEESGLGIAIDPIFPDPEGVTSLLKTVEGLPKKAKDSLKVTNRTACEQWNRGVGFIVAVKDKKEASTLIKIAEENECEAGIAGEVIDKPEIQWRGEIWKYQVGEKNAGTGN